MDPPSNTTATQQRRSYAPGVRRSAVMPSIETPTDSPGHSVEKPLEDRPQASANPTEDTLPATVDTSTPIPIRLRRNRHGLSTGNARSESLGSPLSWSPTPDRRETTEHETPLPWEWEPTPGLGSNTNAEHPATTRKKRTHLTEAESTQLVQLCVAKREHFRLGRVTNFWERIAAIFHAKTGKTVKEPRITVNRLVEARKARIKAQETESGKLQEATELSNAVESWMDHLQTIEDVKESRRLNQARLESERADAEKQQEELLTTIGGRPKRRRAADSDSDFSDSDTDFPMDNKSCSSFSQSTGRERFRARKTRRKNQPLNDSAEVPPYNVMSSALEQIATAIGGLGPSLSNTTTVSEEPLEKRIEQLEDSVRQTKEMQMEVLRLLRSQTRNSNEGSGAAS